MGRSIEYKSPSTLKRDMLRKTFHILHRKSEELENKLVKFRTENILYLSRIQDKLIQDKLDKCRFVGPAFPNVSAHCVNVAEETVSLSCDKKYLTTDSLNISSSSEPCYIGEIPDVIHNKGPSLIAIQNLLDSKFKKHHEELRKGIRQTVFELT